MLTQDQTDALAIAVLSVGGWPVEKTRSALPALRQVELLSPSAVAEMDLGVLTVRLAKNGYNRGLLTSMYAERLQAVMRAVHLGKLSRVSDFVREHDRRAFEALLRDLHGVGPAVAGRAWELLVAGS